MKSATVTSIDSFVNKKFENELAKAIWIGNPMELVLMLNSLGLSSTKVVSHILDDDEMEEFDSCSAAIVSPCELKKLLPIMVRKNPAKVLVSIPSDKWFPLIADLKSCGDDFDGSTYYMPRDNPVITEMMFVLARRGKKWITSTWKYQCFPIDDDDDDDEEWNMTQESVDALRIKMATFDEVWVLNDDQGTALASLELPEEEMPNGLPCYVYRKS